MRTALALLLLAVCLPLGAQTPYLVKDINMTANSFAASSSPANFIRFGSRIYFSATSTASGTELWSTDGTQSGTAQVADVDRGPLSSNPSRFAAVNGTLVFNARDSRGEELWTTDGTAAGTRLLADISTGSRGSRPGDRIVYHGQLIFAADDGIDGNELWITDGTPVGTRFLKDVTPGATSSNPRGFVVFNDAVYFATDDTLWKTDGTENGTVRVKGPGYVTRLTATTFGLFFVGNADGFSDQLWVSDGTENGTHVIGQGTPGAVNYVYETDATAFGDRVLFAARDAAHGGELWISDGTAAGTHILRDINPGINDGVGIAYITVIGSQAFFAATSGAGAEGNELWKTDGTEAGTMIVRDIVPGPGSSFPRGLVALGSKVCFAATVDGGQTLWTSDGTTARTRQINTEHPIGVSGPSNVPTLTAIGGVIYFAGSNSLNGNEPWKSDGTDAGTVMIANLTSDPVPSSGPRDMVAAGDWVYFNAWDGTVAPSAPWPLWRSDGTPEGTVKLFDSSSPPYVLLGRSLLFNKDGIWISDGTPEGTAPAAELSKHFPGAASTFYASGNIVIAAVGDQLWATTTAPGAPSVALGVSPVVFGISVFTQEIMNVAGRLLYARGSGMWTTDGTPDGTYAIAPDLGEYIESGRAVMGGHVFFTTRTFTATAKLWKTDGTFEGSLLVKTVPALIDRLSAAGRNLFFTAAGQLWVSDGTEAGTHSLPATPAQGPLAAIGDSVVFAAGDATTGTELWVSDGTPAGTHLVSDLYPGTSGSSPAKLTSAGGVVYFSAIHDLFGAEPWMTDGTAAGTKLVADINPGLPASGPQQFVQAGDRLFFGAATATTGYELWALPLTTPQLNVGDIRVAEGDSGTVNAQFTVTLSPAASKSVTVDYATADGTATSGTDYTSAMATLTFAPGETSKSIDVAVRGDTSPENNETFFITLKNAAGATLARTSAFAVIDDDDQSADVALSVTFSNMTATVKAANSGPRAATDLRFASTATPALAPPPRCAGCGANQLPSGTAISPLNTDWVSSPQQYFTTAVTARQRDPQLANNSLAWTARGYLAMDALYLTPGSQANVSFTLSLLAQYAVESSNPAVVSVSATTTTPGSTTTFVAHALSIGTATIRLLSATSVTDSLVVDVVPAGTTPRWPGAINVVVNRSEMAFDQQALFTIENKGTAPYSGITATGLVTLSVHGRELGRITLGAKSQRLTLAVSPVETGQQQIDVTYAGDANFLPSTTSFTMTVTRGAATMTASAQRSGTAVNVHVRLVGSQMVTPGGTITFSEQGARQTPATLTATAPGVSEADVTMTGIAAGPHTFTAVYSGDANYISTFLNIPLIEGRGHAVRH